MTELTTEQSPVEKRIAMAESEVKIGRLLAKIRREFDVGARCGTTITEQMEFCDRIKGLRERLGLP